jgi:hypothetical protein
VSRSRCNATGFQLAEYACRRQAGGIHEGARQSCPLTGATNGQRCCAPSHVRAGSAGASAGCGTRCRAHGTRGACCSGISVYGDRERAVRDLDRWGKGPYLKLREAFGQLSGRRNGAPFAAELRAEVAPVPARRRRP